MVDDHKPVHPETNLVMKINQEMNRKTASRR